MQYKKSTTLALAFSVFLVFSGCQPSLNINSANSAKIPTTVNAAAESLVLPETTDSALNSGQQNTQYPPVEYASPEKITITAVGDIMLGRNVGKRLLQNDEGFMYAFKDVTNLLKEGDIVFGNLESPLTANEKSLSKEKKIILRAQPDAVVALVTAGFNMLSLANNHMLDYYAQGMMDTIQVLDANKILHNGAGENLAAARLPAIREINGVSFGLLSYSDMVNFTYSGNPNISYYADVNKPGAVFRDYDLIIEDIEKLKGKVDLIAISLHWGIEESFKVSSEQIEFAHKLLDAGADMILGHHPHQYQGIEIYNGKPIFYSMGNFLFDQNDTENMESFIARLIYNDKKLISLKITPVRIVDKHHVEIQKGLQAENILNRQMKLSSELGTNCDQVEDSLIYDLSVHIK